MMIAQKGQTEKVYETNFKFLSPWLKDIVSKIDDGVMWKKIQVDYNDEGYPVCRYRQCTKNFQVTSMQPLREAEAYCNKPAKEANGAIFLLGSGFGYPIFELFAHKNPGTVVVLFEQDLYLFKAMLHYFDFSPIAQTGEIIFLVGSPGCFANAFHFMTRSVTLFSCTCPTIVLTPAARSNFKTEYREIHHYIFEQLTFQSTFIGNDHLDTLIGLRNLTDNLDVITRQPYISCLKDRFRDVPAFIIANGPSLDKNMQKIKQIKGRGLVLSVESAIVPLTKNGIIPDILTIIERGRETYTYHLKDRHYDGSIALLCLALVDKKVFPAFPGPQIPIFRGTEAINQWFNRHLGDGSCIDAGSNVSHLAMELAVYLGANPIVFVGQDFAYSQDGEMTHSRDASYNEEKIKPALDAIKALPPIFLEGNNGEMLRSNWLWKDFKVGLEIKIAEHPEKLFLNASEGGARITGTVCESLENVIQKYCINPLPCRVDAVVLENAAKVSLSERKKGLAGLLADKKQYVRLLRSLKQELIRGKLACINAIRITRQNDAGTQMEAFDALRETNAEIFKKFYCDNLVLHFSQQVLLGYNYLANRLGKTDTPEQFAEAFKLQFNYFYYLGIICQSLAVSLESTAEQIQVLLNENSTKKELTLCVITRNDGKALAQSLQTMSGFADELIVADIGSTDRTVDIAKALGAEVYRIESPDSFGAVKNFCLDHASGKWVLFLRAGEMITPEDRKELKILLKNPNAEGYLLSVDSGMDGCAVSSPVQAHRLLRNRKEYRFSYRAYEMIPEEIAGNILSAPIGIVRLPDLKPSWELELQEQLVQKDLLEHPEDCYIQYLCGIAQINQERYGDSVPYFKKARETVNFDCLYAPHLYKCLAWALLYLKRYDEALEVLEEGIAFFAFYTDLFVLRAELHRQLFQREAAIGDLLACLDTMKRVQGAAPSPEISASDVLEMLGELRTE